MHEGYKHTWRIRTGQIRPRAKQLDTQRIKQGYDTTIARRKRKKKKNSGKGTRKRKKKFCHRQTSRRKGRKHGACATRMRSTPSDEINKGTASHGRKSNLQESEPCRRAATTPARRNDDGDAGGRRTEVGGEEIWVNTGGNAGEKG